MTHFGHNQNFQQGCGLPNVSRNSDERFCDVGIFIRQRVKPITHVMEFLSFLQDGDGWHCIPDS